MANEKLMSKEEFLKSDEFKEYMRRIRNYPKGFVLSLPIYKMSKPILNAMNVVMENAVKEGLLEMISDGWGWDDNDNFTIVERQYKRL